MKVFIDKDGNYTNETKRKEYSINEIHKINDKILEAKGYKSVLVDTLRNSIQQDEDMIAAKAKVDEAYETYIKAQKDYENLKDSLFLTQKNTEGKAKYADLVQSINETNKEIDTLEYKYSIMGDSMIDNDYVDLSPYEMIDKMFNKDEVSIYIMPDVCLATVCLNNKYVTTFHKLVSDIVRSLNVCTVNRVLYKVMYNTDHESDYIATFTSSIVNGKPSIVIKNKDVYSNPYDMLSDKLSIVAFIWKEEVNGYFAGTQYKPIPIFYNNAKKKYKLGYPGETVSVEVLQRMSGDKFWFNPLRDQSEIQEVQKFLMSYTIKNQ